MKREPAAGTPFAAQPPAALGQHLETWEVCHLKKHIHINTWIRAKPESKQWPTKYMRLGLSRDSEQVHHTIPPAGSFLPHSPEKEEAERNYAQTTLICLAVKALVISRLMLTESVLHV